MNPENCASHISDRHSYLWRKSMFVEPVPAEARACHKQTNQFALTMNSSWRSRNSFIRTNFSHLSQKRPLSTMKSAAEDVLREQAMRTSRTDSMVKSLLIDKDALDKSKQLIDGMLKLKEMKLLNDKQLNRVKFPGIIRHEHVHNDYHERTTNPGYSRNEKGKIYTR